MDRKFGSLWPLFHGRVSLKMRTQFKEGDHYMTKSELVEQMAKNAGISKSAANAALNSFTDSITDALKKEDGKVTLVGFGFWCMK
jgi:hypothetical protein